MIRTYRIDELVEISGVTRRTISDYIAKGLLSGPSHRGRGATYPQSDVDVLHLVPRIRTLMKKEYPNLGALAGFLRQLSKLELSWLASRSTEQALLQGIRRLRLRIQLAGLLPMIAPERIEEVLHNLTPAQISSIDTDRYPIGAVLDLSELLQEDQNLSRAYVPRNGQANGNAAGHRQQQAAADDSASSSWNGSWLDGALAAEVPDQSPQANGIGSLEEVLHRLEDQISAPAAMPEYAGDQPAEQSAKRYSEIPIEKSVHTRLSDISERVERLERLLTAG